MKRLLLGALSAQLPPALRPTQPNFSYDYQDLQFAPVQESE